MSNNKAQQSLLHTKREKIVTVSETKGVIRSIRSAISMHYFFEMADT